MKPINILHKFNNSRIKILMKEKNNNKFNLLSFLNGKHKNHNFSNIYNSSFTNKNNISNINKSNNITINSSINHIVNNITINNNSINGSYNNFNSKYKNSFSKRKEKNYMTYIDKMNVKNDISLKKSTTLSRNVHNSLINNYNQTILYLSFKNSKAFKNRKKFNNKKKKLFLIPNNSIYNSTDSNNIISYHYNLTNENVKNPKENSKCLENRNSNLNKKIVSKKKSFNKKDNNNTNKKNNIIYKNNIKNRFNNKIFFDYILNKVYRKRKKNKNILINIKKDFKSRNSNYIPNNFKKNNSNISKVQINKSVNNNLNKQLNITNKNLKNNMHYSNYDLDRKDNNNNKLLDEHLKNANINTKEEIKKNSSLDNTIKFSKLTSEEDNEGELELDEVQDIIVYYNLNEIGSKNYLFKNKDYNDFIEKDVCKYLNFFMK